MMTDGRGMNALLAGLVLLLLAAPAGAVLTTQETAALQAELDVQGATFSVGPNAATEFEIRDLCGLVPPENWWAEAPSMPRSLKSMALPASFSWCDEGACPPVRNQGNCGSCWAFASVGPLESNILIQGGDPADLSEQYLVSCNTSGWGCGGGWWAHDYHQWRYAYSETGAGAVPEAGFGYAASDLPCGGPHTHPWQIDGWGYVDAAYAVPPVEEIKEAILGYGPVSVAVCVGSLFQRYNGGVFNTSESCGTGRVNHGVVLVGWDDDPPEGGGGCWILRNSWSTWWGEGGYMRIAYGTSNIGYAATYVVYSAPVPAPSADFAADRTQGETPCSVSFSDASAGEVTGWSWAFGDGSGSTERDPVHVFGAPGTYSVSLTVSGPGGTDTETKAGYVSVSPAEKRVPNLRPALMLLGLQ